MRATRAEHAETERAEGEQRANLEARKRLTQLAKANDLLGSIFQNLDPKEVAKAGRPLQVTLVEKLDRAAEQLEGESIGDPLVVADMQEKFGLSLMALAEPKKAVVLLEKARATFEAVLGPDDPRTLVGAYDLGLAHKAVGDLNQALRIQEETLERMKAVLGPNHRDTLGCMNSLAGIYDLRGKRDLSLPLFEETLRRQKATLGAEHPDTLSTMSNLAMIYSDSDKMDLALPLFQETLSLKNAVLGHTHPLTLDTMSKLAVVYDASGKPDLALSMFQETLKLRKETLGPEHPDSLMSMFQLALWYQRYGKPKLALPLIEEVLRLKNAKISTEYPETRRTIQQADFLRNLITAQDRYELNLAKVGPDHIDTLLAHRDMAQWYMATNRLDEAESMLFDIIERLKTRPNDDPIVVFTIRLLRFCHTTRERSMPDSWHTYRCKSLLGGVYLARKQYAAAEPLLRAGYQGMKQREAKIPTQGKVHLSEAAKRLVQLYEATGKKDEATKLRKELDMWPREMGTAAVAE